MRVPRMPTIVRMSMRRFTRMIVPVRMSIPVCVLVRMDIPAAVLVRVAVFIVVHLPHYTPLIALTPISVSRAWCAVSASPYYAL
jgi:hypothetical protein